MIFRKLRSKVRSRNAKSNLVCPLCAQEPSKAGHYHWEDRYICQACGCVFRLDTEEFLEEGDPIFFSPYRTIEREGSVSRYGEVRNWLVANHPEWKDVVAYQPFYDFLCDFESYNHWLNRGNEPSIEEGIEDGWYEQFVWSVLGRSDSLDIYFNDHFEDEDPNDPDTDLHRLHRNFLELKKTFNRF